VGEVRVSPPHSHATKGNRKTDVSGGKAVCKRGGRAALQIHCGEDEEEHVNEGQKKQQCTAD
jgi:hypothetical protein